MEDIVINKDDVISVNDEDIKGTYTLDDFIENILELHQDDLEKLLKGVKCRGLIVSKGKTTWQEGQVKLSVTFTPDEPKDRVIG